MIFGIIICALSVWGIYAPAKLIEMVKGLMAQDVGIPAAIVVRLVLGAALITAAAESRFPVVFQVLGSVAILAAIGLAIMGRARMRKFVAWLDRLATLFIRLWLLLGIAFGGFLIYGASQFF